jgi:hypothetical protein
MLSGAKHLQYLLENKQMRILRAVYPERSERAQDDSPGTLSAACLGRNAARQTRRYRLTFGDPRVHNHVQLCGDPFCLAGRRKEKRLF